jgi:uncharacterized protein (DUF2249 family)
MTPELPLVEKDHACTCGEHDVPHPELDARLIPHALRHGAILGALSRVRPGAAMVLVAPHNPLPLLAEIEREENGAIEVSYLAEGPEAWRLLLTRAA